MTIKQSIEKYLDHVNRYRSKGTYLYYLKSFKLIESSLNELGYYELNDIDDLIFEELTDFLLKVTNKKNSKINDTISCLITLLNFFEVQHPKRFKLKDDMKYTKTANRLLTVREKLQEILNWGVESELNDNK